MLGVTAQLAGLVGLLIGYSWLRKSIFQRPAAVAYAHAHDVIEWQRRLGIPISRVELPLQRWVIDRPGLLDFFNVYYQQFKPALYLCALACLLLAPAAFRRIGVVFLFATAIALPWYALYPLAPPRLMPEYGFVDTLAVFGGAQSSASGVGGANQFAAMPSMHIGWTLIGALWLAAALPWWRIGAVIGGLHLTLMCLTVMITGNHYALDILGGLLVVGTACVLARLWESRRNRRGEPHSPSGMVRRRSGIRTSGAPV